MISSIAIEKDWVVVIAKSLHTNELAATETHTNHSDEEKNNLFKKRLTSMNATVRRIDLTTAVVAPLASGLLMSFFNLSETFNGVVLSALFFAAWNLVSFVFEYELLESVYRMVPELKKEKATHSIRALPQVLANPLTKIYDGWSLYVKQGLVLLPGISFALLHLTVLSFDSVTIGYAKSQNLTETCISILQGVGSIYGILGTVAFTCMHNRMKIKLPYVGIIGAAYQSVFLVMCVGSVWLPGSPFILAERYQPSFNLTAT
jgi:hypothetical protein